MLETVRGIIGAGNDSTAVTVDVFVVLLLIVTGIFLNDLPLVSNLNWDSYLNLNLN